MTPRICIVFEGGCARIQTGSSRFDVRPEYRCGISISARVLFEEFSMRDWPQIAEAIDPRTHHLAIYIDGTGSKEWLNRACSIIERTVFFTMVNEIRALTKNQRRWRARRGRRNRIGCSRVPKTGVFGRIVPNLDAIQAVIMGENHPAIEEAIRVINEDLQGAERRRQRIERDGKEPWDS